METITQLSTGYQSNLTHETELLVQAQKEIDNKIHEADTLSSQVREVTSTRNDRLESEASLFKGGAAVEELAQSAENAYSMVESIISTLQAIDEMLPTPDRLSTVNSPHRKH